MKEAKQCVICGRNLDEVFSLNPDKRKRVTCNNLHSKYLRNVNSYIERKICKRLEKIKQHKRTSTRR